MDRLRLNPRIDPEVQKVLRQIDEELRNLHTQNIDLHRRRFVNAEDAQSRGDFVTRRQLDAAVEGVAEKIAVLDRRRRRMVFTSTGTVPTTGNLPAATHPMDYGYWIPDGQAPLVPALPEFYDENKGYTNLYIAWFRIGRQYNNSEDNGGTPSSLMANAIPLVQRAFSEGRNIKVLLDLPFAPSGDIPAHMDRVLDGLAPYWSKVKYVDLADEPSYTRVQLEGFVADFRRKCRDRGLAEPKIGATFNYQGNFGVLVTDQINANGLDWCGIEAYINPPQGGPTQEADEAALRTFLTQAKARIPGSKRIHFVMMGYARNGVAPTFTFVNKASLENLQRVCYLMGYNDARVDCIDIFSYGRTSGTRDLFNNNAGGIKLAHQQIWAAITGQGQQAPPGGGNVPPGQTCGGVNNAPNCPRWCRGGSYEDQVVVARDIYISTAPPTVIDPNDRTHVLDPPAFMAGVVARFNSDNPALIAQITPGNDGKEITVKSRTDSTYSDQYAMWFGGPPVAYISSFVGPDPVPAYRATCYPASF